MTFPWLTILTALPLVGALVVLALGDRNKSLARWTALAFSLVSLSALSFLGLGSGPGSADWGRMLSDNLSLLQQAPLTVIAPGIALVLTATSMNLLGDRLYELMSDSGKGR